MNRLACTLSIVAAVAAVTACSSMGGSFRMPGTSQNRSYSYAEPIPDSSSDEPEVAANEPFRSEDGQSPLEGLYPATEDRYWYQEDSFEETVSHGAKIADRMRIAATGSRYVGYSSVPGDAAFMVVIRSQSTVWQPYFWYDVVYTEETPPVFNSMALRVGDQRWDYPVDIDSQNRGILGRESGYAWMDIEPVIRMAIDNEPVQVRFYSDSALSLTYLFNDRDRQAVYYMLRTVLRDDFGNELTLENLDMMLEEFLKEFSRERSGKQPN